MRQHRVDRDARLGAPTAQRVVVSYRPQDEGSGGRLRADLSRRFGEDRVLRDSEADEAVAVVALIGPGWTEIADGRSQRLLDNPADGVRRTLEAAFAADLPVVPVVVDGGVVPHADELPASLARLAALEPIPAIDQYWDKAVELVVDRLRPPRGRSGLMGVVRRRPRLTVAATVSVVAGVVGILANFGVFDRTEPQRGTLEVQERAAVGTTFAKYLEDSGEPDRPPPHDSVAPDEPGYVYDIQVGLERAEHDRYSIRWTLREVSTGQDIEPFVDLVGATFSSRDAPGLHRVWIPCPRREALRYVVMFMLVDEAQPRPRTPLWANESEEAECRRAEK